MATTARRDLERELRDPEFRKVYGASEAKSELAIALADARHSLGLTQEEMSKRMGVTQPYIAKLESGDANPTIGAIGSMLGLLNLRLRMKVVPLLAKPVSSGSASSFFLRTTFGCEVPADASGIVIMATSSISSPRQASEQPVLFPVSEYDSFGPLVDVNEVCAVPAKGQPFEEVLGGQRV